MICCLTDGDGQIYRKTEKKSEVIIGLQGNSTEEETNETKIQLTEDETMINKIEFGPKVETEIEDGTQKEYVDETVIDNSVVQVQGETGKEEVQKKEIDVGSVVEEEERKQEVENVTTDLKKEIKSTYLLSPVKRQVVKRQFLKLISPLVKQFQVFFQIDP